MLNKVLIQKYVCIYLFIVAENKPMIHWATQRGVMAELVGIKIGYFAEKIKYIKMSIAPIRC